MALFGGGVTLGVAVILWITNQVMAVPLLQQEVDFIQKDRQELGKRMGKLEEKIDKHFERVNEAINGLYRRRTR